MKKAKISVITMVAPVGVSARMERHKPRTAQKTERIAEQTTTALKFLKSRIAESAGKMINAVISKDPTRRIARTITTAVTVAISKLYSPAETPEALTKVSSKVTAKIL